jgi:Protein of unknown function (DUF4232)
VNKAGSNAVYMVVAVVLVLAASAQAYPVQSASALLACTSSQLSLTFDSEGGNFDVISHSGTLLVLRNIGGQTCSPSGLPSLAFEDASHQILPVAVPQSAEETGELHWVSGEVFDTSQYFSPAFVPISFATDVLRAPLTSRLCAPSGQDTKYRFAYLKRDPVYVRSKS